MTEILAETVNGRVRGTLNDGINIFWGIPYGAPTSGPNRFRPPVEPAPWPETRDATRPGPIAPQPTALIEAHKDLLSKLRVYLSHGDELPLTSEDCLTVNVFTPAVGDGVRRPVMVWFHGGAQTAGSANEPEYDGRHLAARGDVVVVTVNHRLGVLGYLYLGALGGAGYERSGNAGTLDLVAALRWVRDNIASFGGDPGCVTIFGESGGGQKVATLMAMPAAHGLFHRAIVQSGVARTKTLPDPDGATATAREVLRELGIPESEAWRLQRVPISTLMDASSTVTARIAGNSALPAAQGNVWQPVLDGIVLSRHPWNTAQEEWGRSGVPLLIGTTADELSTFNPTDDLSDAELLAALTMVPPARAAEVIEVYRSGRPGHSNRQRLNLIVTDWLMRAPSIDLAELYSRSADAPAYLFLLSWVSPVLGGVYRAFHGLDIPLMFHHPADVPAIAGSPNGIAISDQMADAWIAFARTGNPDHPGIPHWPAYSAQGRSTMVFDADTRLENDPWPEERALWT